MLIQPRDVYAAVEPLAVEKTAKAMKSRYMYLPFTINI